MIRTSKTQTGKAKSYFTNCKEKQRLVWNHCFTETDIRSVKLTVNWIQSSFAHVMFNCLSAFRVPSFIHEPLVVSQVIVSSLWKYRTRSRLMRACTIPVEKTWLAEKDSTEVNGTYILSSFNRVGYSWLSIRTIQGQTPLAESDYPWRELVRQRSHKGFPIALLWFKTLWAMENKHRWGTQSTRQLESRASQVYGWTDE